MEYLGGKRRVPLRLLVLISSLRIPPRELRGGRRETSSGPSRVPTLSDEKGKAPSWGG